MLDIVADDVVAFTRLLRFMATGDRSIVPADPYAVLSLLVEAHRRDLLELVAVTEHRLLEVLPAAVFAAGINDFADLEGIAQLYGLERVVSQLSTFRRQSIKVPPAVVLAKSGENGFMGGYGGRQQLDKVWLNAKDQVAAEHAQF